MEAGCRLSISQTTYKKMVGLKGGISKFVADYYH